MGDEAYWYNIPDGAVYWYMCVRDKEFIAQYTGISV
jgi:hypothetical protein